MAGMLNEWLVGGAFVWMLVLCRVGAALMVTPGIGEAYVPVRVRLLLAAALSTLLAPVLAPKLPAPPTTVGILVLCVAGEILVGIFMGWIARVLINAVHTAGTIIATQSGLAAAVLLDITQTSQTTVITNLLSVTAVTLLFASDLHHVILSGLYASYNIFPPGVFPPVTDLSQYAVSLVTRSFAVGVQLAAPQIAIGLIIYLGAGVLARLMPTMQIFFVLMPPQLLLSFIILMITISSALLWYIGYMEEILLSFPSLP